MEKNTDASRQETYDAKKKYMNPATATMLTIATAILPAMGFTPYLTMNRMAEMSADFLHSGEMEVVRYFAFGNIKGALVSIAIGAALYFGIARTLLMRTDENGTGREYVNRWPEWMDLENVVYRPIILYALPFVGGVVCRVLDSLVDWIVVILRKTIYKDSPITVELSEGNALTHLLGSLANGIETFGRRHSARKRKEKQVDYVHKYAIDFKAISESRFIIVMKKNTAA